MAQGRVIPEVSSICAYVASRTGSALSPQQVARLNEKILPRLDRQSEDQYLLYLKSIEGASELASLMSTISVHKTDLFRDEVQLKAFETEILLPLCSSGRSLSLWSAGCATGEEVATLLVLLERTGANPGSSVLGTDIAEGALEAAKKLTFGTPSFGRVPEDVRRRFFKQTGDGYALLDPLKARASFRRHNLMDEPYPSAGGDGLFDVIFCRNVLIYFTSQAFDWVTDHLARALRPGGTLVLSSAEPILKPHPLLTPKRCDQAVFYQRRSPQAAEAESSPFHRPPFPSTFRPRPPAADKPAPAPPAAAPVDDPKAEARALFALILDWAAQGEADEDTEKGLRKCLYLDPHLSQARYLLGMILEGRGANADAASEYRRALQALREGHARSTPFFLNHERLKKVCEHALARLGFPV